MNLQKKMKQAASIQTLKETIRKQIALVKEEFLPLAENRLNFQPGPGKWSILECVDHLNRYARFYLPEIQEGLEKSGAGNGQINWSWMGKKSIESVHPDNGKPQKTFKRMNPSMSSLGTNVLEEFCQHQELLLELLERGKSGNLNKKVVRVEFFKLLKIRLGDAMEFAATHQQRHLNQALRILKG